MCKTSEWLREQVKLFFLHLFLISSYQYGALPGDGWPCTVDHSIL